MFIRWYVTDVGRLLFYICDVLASIGGRGSKSKPYWLVHMHALQHNWERNTFKIPTAICCVLDNFRFDELDAEGRRYRLTDLQLR